MEKPNVDPNTETCPHCNSNWIDKPIPEKHQHLYGGKKYYSRLIGLYDREKDRTVRWQCPDCKATFDRV